MPRLRMVGRYLGSRSRGLVVGLMLGLLLWLPCVGCGFDRIEPELPAAVEGFSLADLEDIQDDQRLTDDEKREAIREGVGAPESESGDRLVEYLLTFQVP